MTAIKIGERYRLPGGPVGVAFEMVAQDDAPCMVRLRFDDGDATDWVYSEILTPDAQSTPSFSNGDVVKLTFGDDPVALQGRVRDEDILGPDRNGFTISTLLDAGWSLEVVEHASKPLPTEPGLYVMKGMSGNPGPIILCFSDGYWGFTHRAESFEGEAESVARSWMRDPGLRRLIEEPTS